jgi:hypothetical protein
MRDLGDMEKTRAAYNALLEEERLKRERINMRPHPLEAAIWAAIAKHHNDEGSIVNYFTSVTCRSRRSYYNVVTDVLEYMERRGVLICEGGRYSAAKNS